MFKNLTDRLQLHGQNLKKLFQIDQMVLTKIHHRIQIFCQNVNKPLEKIAASNSILAQKFAKP